MKGKLCSSKQALESISLAAALHSIKSLMGAGGARWQRLGAGLRRFLARIPKLEVLEWSRRAPRFTPEKAQTLPYTGDWCTLNLSWSKFTAIGSWWRLGLPVEEVVASSGVVLVVWPWLKITRHVFGSPHGVFPRPSPIAHMRSSSATLIRNQPTKIHMFII